MNKYLLPILMMFLLVGCQAQNKNPDSKVSLDKFDEFVLSYEPLKNESNESSFLEGSRILQEQKDYYKANERFTFANYWNIGTAFGKFNESKELIELAFTSAIALDKQGMCQYVDVMTGMGNVFELRISELYHSFKEECSSKHEESDINIEQYAKEGSFDLDLIKLLEEVKRNDLKYRSETNIDWDRQNLLDQKNQAIIDSIFEIHGEYIGRKYVGENWESIMFLVIQHSELDYMEKYLSIVQKAVSDNQVDAGVLKYLLDRISTRRNNYQYFGTQSGVKYADKEEIEQVKKEYKID